MATNPLLLITLTIFLSLSTPFTIALSPDSEALVSDLLALQSQSPSGLIRLTDPLLNAILDIPSPRPFSFLIFFDAKRLHSNPELSLTALKLEFSLLPSSFLSNNNDDPQKIFFFEVEFGESQKSFELFGVNSLPHIKLVPPSSTDLKSGSIEMTASDFSGGAESMAAFVESRTKLSIGPIHRPPPISKKQLMLIGAVMLSLSPFLVRRIVSGKTLLHNRNAWMAGAIFVYFFSVSGAMHNIIRKMPMFLADRSNPGKLTFFYQGSGMQLGAEGFAVGFLYTVVGLLLAFATHVLVSLRNRTVQRLLMVFGIFVSFWAVNKVIFLDNWKTGYTIHAYWPSSWN